MKKALLSLATIAILASCGGSKTEAPAENETSNETSTEQTAETTESSVSGVFNVDTETSMLHWKGAKVVAGSHHGVVDFKSGSVKVEDGKVVGGEAVIDMTTIEEKDASSPEMATKLVTHLTSGDFFLVDSFPTAKIAVKSVENGTVNADLTIKDITKAISFPAEISVSEDVVNVNAKFTIDRTDWGVVFLSGNFVENLAKENVIKDEIEFEVMLTAKK